MLLDERVIFEEEKCFRSETSILGGGGESLLFKQKSSIEKFYIRNQGLYPDAHGVLANEGYDSEIGRVVDYDLFHYNESIVPIWV